MPHEFSDALREGPAMTGTPRILFVDDEQSVLDSIRRTLRDRAGSWQMCFSTSARDALAVASAEPISVIVSDYMMPGMNGIQLLEELKTDEQLSRIPVVILTGNSETDLKRNALERGALDLVNKPIAKEDLTARIISALRLREAEEELRRHNELLEEKVRKRTASLKRSRLGIVFRLARAAEYRDEETGNHVQRVAMISRILAESLGMSPEQSEQLFLASALHDMGKLGIPDAILLKADRLSEAERAIMQDHCRIGWDILTYKTSFAAELEPARAEAEPGCEAEDVNPVLSQAAEIALAHHERWDGAGYPNRLSGEDIPLVARIVSIADVYDALRHARPYKAAMTPDEAMAIIREGSGTHFDPGLVECFERCHEMIQIVIDEHGDRKQNGGYAAA